MDCKELNPANDFKAWEPQLLQELHSLAFKEQLGSKLLFEDDSIILWNLKLAQGERMPFLKHNKNFSWIAENDAVLKSRFGNGRIAMIKINKGDTAYCEHSNKNYINDLENLSKIPIVFKILEYKNVFHDMLPVSQ